MPTYFNVLQDISIDAVTLYATDDNAVGTDDLTVHLMEYDSNYTNGSKSGDLTNGLIKHTANFTDVGNDAIDLQTMTLIDSSPDVRQNKILVMVVKMVGSGADLHIRGLMKYHFK
jgi:hypothetical protein